MKVFMVGYNYKETFVGCSMQFSMTSFFRSIQPMYWPHFMKSSVARGNSPLQMLKRDDRDVSLISIALFLLQYSQYM